MLYADVEVRLDIGARAREALEAYYQTPLKSAGGHASCVLVGYMAEAITQAVRDATGPLLERIRVHEGRAG